MAVHLKRVYEKPSRKDGARVLVDRLWPRGLRKEDAALDEWLQRHRSLQRTAQVVSRASQQWSKFRQKYLEELAAEPGHTQLQQLYAIKNKRSQLTLLFASKNLEHNNATVLQQLLEGHRKPPTGTGPARAASAGRARAVRRK